MLFTHLLAVVHVHTGSRYRIVAHVERFPQLGLGSANAPPGDRGQQVGAEPGLLRQLVALAHLGGHAIVGAGLAGLFLELGALGSRGRRRRPYFGLDGLQAVNVGAQLGPFLIGQTGLGVGFLVERDHLFAAARLFLGEPFGFRQ